jgi:hypothetical protein
MARGDAVSPGDWGALPAERSASVDSSKSAAVADAGTDGAGAVSAIRSRDRGGPAAASAAAVSDAAESVPGCDSGTGGLGGGGAATAVTGFETAEDPMP